MEGQLSTYTFLDEYRQHISPAISAIDVLLKSADYPLGVSEVADALDIDAGEVASIAAAIGCDAIDRMAFVAIMSRGSSRICRLFKRESAAGSPPTYTAAQIAYIYNLDTRIVEDAYDKLRIKEATPFTMSLVFSQIPY